MAEAGDQSDLNQDEEQAGAGPLSGLWLLDHVEEGDICGCFF